ncbi:hypothetical protein BDV95DRAFT_589148 [Massariosphaeria phaeospora]|uniref:Disease resistance R13L4/SHOC-2-like LRR domain-containing protein n=1 Tax=Massariosphaeria phaeospora TaxID=100035 RepID=A0A7C8MVS5_9PLEO|nr:hypothetical protein BDV95DRAFT_589148 [Massariosphaeria phaeospora]
MAELAGSIIGIVSAGTKVTLVLSQLAADVGSAGKEARMIRSEIRSFCAVVKTLGDTLKKIQDSPYYAHCAELIKDMTDTSLEMFTEILDAAESLSKITKGKDGKDGKFSIVDRVQWAVFQKPKIMILRAAIEAYKSNLALMLGTLNTAQKVARRTLEKDTLDVIEEDEQDRSLLQNLELEQRASLINLEAAQRKYHEDASDRPMESSEWARILDAERNDTLSPSTEGLVVSARREIASIRSSLSRSSSFDPIEVQEMVSRHSQRLSILVTEDNRRLSQRWSTVLSPVISREHTPNLSLPPSVPFGLKSSLSTAEARLLPSYRQLRGLLLGECHEDRSVILRALTLEFSENSPDHISPTASSIPSQRTIDFENRGLTPKSSEEYPLESDYIRGLRYLALQSNKLDHIPDAVLQLPSLDILDLSKNRLRAIPDAVSSLKQLKVLSVEKNKIRILPDALGAMESLQMFKYGGNQVIFPSDTVLDVPHGHPAHQSDSLPPRHQNEIDILRTGRLKFFLRNYRSMFSKNAILVLNPPPTKQNTIPGAGPSPSPSQVQIPVAPSPVLSKTVSAKTSASSLSGSSEDLNLAGLHVQPNNDRPPIWTWSDGSRTKLLDRMDGLATASAHDASPTTVTKTTPESPVIIVPASTRDHRRSKSQEPEAKSDADLLAPAGALGRRRSHLDGLTTKEKRYSTLLAAADGPALDGSDAFAWLQFDATLGQPSANANAAPTQKEPTNPSSR